MNSFLAVTAGLSCLCLCLGLVWAITSPRIRDGVVVKFGMILMCLGFLGLADAVMHHECSASAILLINGGLAVAMVGISVRMRNHPTWSMSAIIAVDHENKG